MSTKLKTETATKRTPLKKNRMASNGQEKVDAKIVKDAEKKEPVKVIEIPAPEARVVELLLVGDRPLVVNNKMNVAQELDKKYSGEGGKSGSVPTPHRSKDEQYAMAFYVMPSSKYQPPNPKGKYGIPASGINKCFGAGVRTSGISDNTTISIIQKSVQIMSDEVGLCQITFDRLERDVRPVSKGPTSKVPEMRHRPMFHGWKCKIKVRYNPKIISLEGLINIFNYAGMWIGLCEIRAQKSTGEAGGFTTESV